MKCRIDYINNIIRTIITIGYINNIIRTIIMRSSQLLAVKATKVARGRRRSIGLSHVLRARRRKRVSPIILNAERTRACHTCSDSAISRSRHSSLVARRFERSGRGILGILVATFRATSREKSYRISMPRCLPTSAAEWIPGVPATEG